jgi:signal transduction histidine kinase
MNRLVSRFVLSHLLVAVVGAAATFVLVRVLTPQLFDQQVGQMGGGLGRGMGLREEVSSAVTSALTVGVIVGVAVAGILGTLAAYRLTRPLSELGAATRALATGRYAVTVPDPGTTELDELAQDIRGLAGTLAETEQRRIRLLGEVGHEMRTPLTVIDATVEGMIDGVLPCDVASLDQLSAETRRLRRLADDLSALSRAEEGRLELRLVPADVDAVVIAAAERLRAQADDASIHLQITSPSALTALIDPDRIAQVVTNLVGNALHATPARGHVRVEVEARADDLTITVGDDGVGLAAEDLERVFERFYRAPQTSAHRATGGETGSGIGLTISRRIVEAHGGSLTASSAGLARGCTFTVVLPRHRSTGAPEQ